MKKFNQMSEKQMSKTNGGFIGVIVLLAGSIAAAATVSTGAGIVAANAK